MVDEAYCRALDVARPYHGGELVGFSGIVRPVDTAQCIIATAVQMFFAWRVKVLTGNLWITSIIVITGIVSLRTSSSPYIRIIH